MTDMNDVAKEFEEFYKALKPVADKLFLDAIYSVANPNDTDNSVAGDIKCAYASLLNAYAKILREKEQDDFESGIQFSPGTE